MLIYHDFQVSSGISPDCHFRRDIQEEKEASIIRMQEDTDHRYLKGPGNQSSNALAAILEP